MKRFEILINSIAVFFVLMSVSCQSGSNSRNYYQDDCDGYEYDGEYESVEDGYEEYYEEYDGYFTVYSSYFRLPYFQKIYSFVDPLASTVYFQPRGGMVTFTDSSGKEGSYELYDSDFEGSGDLLYKAVDEEKYILWRSDNSGMLLITGDPAALDMCACIAYYFTNEEVARRDMQNFPSWQTAGDENQSSGYDETEGSYDYDGGSESRLNRSKTSGVCPDCGGKGYRMESYSASPLQNSYKNYLGDTCPICGYATEHYHRRCTTCKRF